MRSSPPKSVMMTKAALRPGERLLFAWGHKGLSGPSRRRVQMVVLEVWALGELGIVLGKVSGLQFS